MKNYITAMKRLILMVLFISVMLTLNGQSHGITYQAIIINPDAQELPGIDINGNYMPNQTLTLRFTIQDESGVIEYQETQSTSTDSFGMINVTIGNGITTALSPVAFIDIDWDGTPKDLKVEVSIGETANDYSELSMQKLYFVPYAYHRNITATGTLIVDGATTLRNTLDVTNGSSTNLTGSLTVGETSTLNGDLTVNATTGLNGQVTIIADVNGTDDQYGSYPLRVEGSNQGIGIRIDGSRDNANNFVTFWDAAGIQGRIEGQTSGDKLNDPQYIFDQSLYAAQTIVQAVNLATALSASIIDPGNAVIEGANSIALAAEITAYNVFAFENLGVTYESGAGDYAEWLPRLYPDEEINSGQIVGVYGGKITKETDNAEMAMVVSNKPIVLGNMPSDSIGIDNYEKVGFMGQVRVWVVGKVKKGDYIIPFRSGSGYGKAVSPGDLSVDMMDGIVGRSWSAVDNEGVHLVNTVIGIKSNEWLEFIKSDEKDINTLKEEIKRLENKVTRSDDILSRLVPGYKEAMETSASQADNVSSSEKEVKVSDQTVVIKNIDAGELFLTREAVINTFDRAFRLLKEQSVDIDKDPFYSRFYSDPVYKEKVIAQVLKSWGKNTANTRLTIKKQ
jgi:hypothetical protein